MSFGSWRRVGAVVAAAAALVLTGCSAGTAAGGDGGAGKTSGISVALSNGFVNGWRLTLIDKFEKEAEKLKKDGTVSKYTTVNAPGENSATEQASQIRSLVLQKPDML